MTDSKRPIMPPIKVGRRTGVRTDETQLVSFKPLTEGTSLPIMCSPNLPRVSLPEWARAHREEIESRLLEHGAMLFRGFDVPDTKCFNACIDAISDGAVEYLFRASPRTQIDPKYNIYTSTDYPASEKIFPHNEHSYSPVFPLRLYFFCLTPSRTGGETPIGDTRWIYQRIPADIRERFARKQIMYVRNYGDGMGLPWKTVFQTEDRAEVEAYCRSVGITVEWKPGERLRTRQQGPAIVIHPRTGKPVWFNHGTFFNALTLPDKVRERLLAEFAPDELPQNTFYGDGVPIEAEVIRTLQSIYVAAMTQFAWQKGDVLYLDNMLTVHGRNEFTGARRILTGMSVRLRGEDLQRVIEV